MLAPWKIHMAKWKITFFCIGDISSNSCFFVHFHVSFPGCKNQTAKPAAKPGPSKKGIERADWGPGLLFFASLLLLLLLLTRSFFAETQQGR